MIVTVLFIIGFIIIYLTRPKQKIVPFEGLNLECRKSSEDEDKLDEDNEFESEPNQSVESSYIEQIDQQKENLHQEDPSLQTEKPNKNSIQYLGPIPSLQYAGLFKDENTANNLPQYQEKDLEQSILVLC